MTTKRKSGSKALTYSPEKKKYEVLSDGVILGRVKKATELAQTIKKLAEQVDSNHSANTATIDAVVDLFQSKHDLGLPEDKRYVQGDLKSAKAADIIFRVLGMLMGPMQPEYVAPAGSPRDVEKHGAIEEHLSHIDAWLMQKYNTRWDIQNRFWQLLVGRSYLQQTYLPFYWDREIRKRKDGEKPEKDDGDEALTAKNTMYNERVAGYKGYAGPPFFVECLDPRTVFELRNSMGPYAWVKIYDVERFELVEAFEKVGKSVKFNEDGKVSVGDLEKPAGLPLARQSEQTTLKGNVTYYEYLDDTMVYYVVGDEVVYQYQHDGGIKIFPAYGLQTGFKEYNLAAVGILWAVRNELVQYDFLRTLWFQKAYLDVFPAMFAELGENDSPLNDDDGKPKDWVIEPMTVKQIRGKLVNAMKEAGTGMDFRAVVEMVAGDIDLATIPGLARGVGGAQQPGYAINQLRQAMATMWKPIVESAGGQASQRHEHYLWTVKHIVMEKVTVFGQFEDEETGATRGDYFDLDPDDIQDFFRVICTLKPDLPIDSQGNMLSMAKLQQEGMIDWDTFVREGLGKNNPQALLKRIQRDQAIRAMLPAALVDAEALGRVKLQNSVLKAYGLDKGNSFANMDLMALRAGQAKQPPPDGGGDQPPAAGAAAPPPGPPGAPGAGPVIAPATAGGTGAPIPQAAGVQVTGANPANPTPGPRK